MQTYQAIDWQERQFRQYHVRRLLKRDRIGALWLAEDRQQRRLVVLRLLPGVATDAHEYLHLFGQITLASSRLEHPHILPVYDSGVQDGNRDEAIPYLVYPYLEQATTLHAHLQRSGGTLPASETFRYLFGAARAIDYAHSQQVIHGGIQPACLLLAGNRLLVSDFGLTSLLNSDITVSRTFSIDLPYLAPEQVQGKTEPSSDCYSLAVIAYQLCAGRLPFEGKGNPYNLLLQQLTMVPPAPGRFNPALSLPMETVLLKALSRQPQQRYADCSEMMDTLNRAWRGLPLDPRDDPEATMTASWSKRFLSQPDLSYSTIPAPQQSVSPTQPPLPPSEFSTVQSTQPAAPSFPSGSYSTEAMRATVQSTQSSMPLTLPSRQSSAPSASLLKQQWSAPSAPPLPPSPPPAVPAAGGTAEKKTLLPMRITPESPPVAPTEHTIDPPPQEGMLKEILKGKLNRRTVLIGGASAAVLAAGGATLLTLSLRSAPAKLPPGPQHFTPGKPLIHLTAHTDFVMDVAWDSSGRYIASGSTDTYVMLWDVGSILQKKPTTLQVMSQPTRKWKFPQNIDFNSLSWTSSGHKLIVSGALTGPFVLFDPLSNSDTQQQYNNPSNDPNNFFTSIFRDALSDPHSDMLAAIDLAKGQIKVQLWQQRQPAKAVASLSQNALKSDNDNAETLAVIGWSCDGTMIAGLTSFLNLVVWDVKTHSVEKTIQLPHRPQKINNPNVEAPLLRWSPFDPHIVAVAVIETILIVDVRSGKILDTLSTDNKDAYTPPQDTTAFPNWVPQVLSFNWSPNGRYIIAGYSQAGTTMAVWDLQKKNVKKDQEGGHVQDYLFPPPGSTNAHTGSIFDLSWSPDGRYLATGSADHTILVWQVDADEQ